VPSMGGLVYRATMGMETTERDVPKPFFADVIQTTFSSLFRILEGWKIVRLQRHIAWEENTLF
jgi:hypothetical protein